MVLGSSMMRQYLAMCIVALAMDHLIQTVSKGEGRKTFYLSIAFYVLAAFFASLFHRSALFTLPAFILAFFDFKFSKRSFIILLFFAIIWFAFGYTLLLSPLSQLMTDQFDAYNAYEEIEGNIGFGALFYLLLYIIIFSHFNLFTKEQRLVCAFASLSVAVLPFVTVYEFVSRLALYFSMFSIVVYPIFFKAVSRNNWKLLLIPLILLTLYGYWGFFHNPLWAKAYQYTTIFSVGGWQ